MTKTTMQVEEAVAGYFDAWNAAPDDRDAHVAEVFTEDAYYCDGAFEVVGRVAIVDMMDGVMGQFTDATFELASPVDHHHAQARFAWRMISGTGATVMDGIDAIRLSDDGQITTALGFFGVDIPTGEDGSTPHTFRWERVYDVSADDLFGLVSDLGVYAAVAPNLASIEVVEGEGVGMVRRCTNPEGESWTETYSQWVPGEQFSTVVDVSTYPPSLRAMIDALEMTVVVEPLTDRQARVIIEIDAQLSDGGTQVLVDGGAADELFQPILDGWEEHLHASAR